MQHREAVKLIQNGIKSTGGTWADLGAGSGTFTLALASAIGANGLIYAIDKSKQVLGIRPSSEMAVVKPLQKDFTETLELSNLDGILMANSIHFIADKKNFLELTLPYLKPRGHFILVEYDKTNANPWVPYPLSFRAFEKLAKSVGLTQPEKIGTIKSIYQAENIYSAFCTKKD
jgi:ubiquinone/menaquinone biosynthesis C-methylase UbiE